MSSYLIKCSACGAENRIPEEKEGVAGHCGNCKGELPPLYAHPRVMSEPAFDDFVRSYPGAVLAEFWAPW